MEYGIIAATSKLLPRTVDSDHEFPQPLPIKINTHELIMKDQEMNNMKETVAGTSI
jgi:hypothetical protein